MEWDPTRCSAWTRFAELERSLGETQRARAIYELAISQPRLDMPEVRGAAVSRQLSDGPQICGALQGVRWRLRRQGQGLPAAARAPRCVLLTQQALRRVYTHAVRRCL